MTTYTTTFAAVIFVADTAATAPAATPAMAAILAATPDAATATTAPATSTAAPATPTTTTTSERAAKARWNNQVTSRVPSQLGNSRNLPHIRILTKTYQVR